MHADQDSRTGRAPGARRRSGVAALWVLGVLATTLNGVVVGYGAIWFQLFGDSADAADYRVSAGGYATAALVLLVTVPALVDSSAPRWLVPTAVVLAVLLGMLALASAVTSVDAEGDPLDRDDPWGDVLDGVGGVLWAPWTGVLLVLGGLALVRAGSRRLSDAR